MRILVINAHPAKARKSLCGSMAEAYIAGAKAAGHDVSEVQLSKLKCDPILHEGFTSAQPLEPDLLKLRKQMEVADHWVLVFPLWLALPPALLKGVLERIITKGYAFDYKGKYPIATDVFKGKSISMLVTCGMPSFVYYWFSGAHATKALGTTFKLCGMRIAHTQALGPVTAHADAAHTRYAAYVAKARKFGACGW